MSRSHGCATAQNLAEFAQNLEMSIPKLEKSCSFTIFHVFFVCMCTFYVTFRVFFVHFLAQNCQKFCFDRAKKSSFRMSGSSNTLSIALTLAALQQCTLPL